MSYPISERFKVLEGLEIYKSSVCWMAFLVVEIDGRKTIRFYRWRLKPSGWKVDLARFGVETIDWNKVAEWINNMKQKYNI